MYFWRNLIIISLIFLPRLVHGQCSSTAAIGGGTFTNSNLIGSLPFINPGNAASSNNSMTTATALAVLSTANTNYLVIQNFGFTIPVSAVICGINVEKEGNGGSIGIGGDIVDNSVRLVVGGVISGNNKATGTSWPLTKAYSSYGSSSDLWGLTLTPTDINSSSFGVAISARITSGISVLPFASVDYVRVTVSYANLIPIKLIDFTGKYKIDRVSLIWHTAGDPEHSLFYVQKSVDQLNWSMIDTISGKQIGGRVMEYTSTDLTPATGINYYRLHYKMESGAIENSDVIKVIVSERPSPISIFPNPATDYIIINNIAQSSKIRIFNVIMQEQVIQLNPISSSGYKIDCRALKPGIYFIKTNERTARFIKR